MARCTSTDPQCYARAEGRPCNCERWPAQARDTTQPFERCTDRIPQCMGRAAGGSCTCPKPGDIRTVVYKLLHEVGHRLERSSPFTQRMVAVLYFHLERHCRRLKWPRPEAMAEHLNSDGGPA